MKKITIFTDAWDPQINGVVSTLQATKKELEKRNYIVDVVHPGMYKITIPLQPSTGIYMPLLPLGIVDEHVKNTDHIHISTEGSIGLAARYACNNYKKPFTTSFHTKYPEYVEIHTGIPSRVSNRYFRWFHRTSSAVMCTTPSMAEYCNNIGIKNTVIWSRGVDTDLFKPKNKKPYDKIRAIYLGRISAEKNIDAFLSIKDENIEKTLIGDGPQLTEYKRQYPDARFLGKMNKYQIAEELPNYDVFAWPSLTDTFGLVVLEAMASGLPVAAFRNEVNEFIIEDSISGVMSNNLVDAIYACSKLNTVDAIARSKKFSWSAATDQFESYLV